MNMTLYVVVEVAANLVPCAAPPAEMFSVWFSYLVHLTYVV